MKARFYVAVLLTAVLWLPLACTPGDQAPATPEASRSDSASSTGSSLISTRVLGTVSDTTLHTLRGDSLQLLSAEHSVLLVNFWATWCAPCREEIPDLIKLYDEYEDQGLMIVGLALDEEGEEVVRPFVDEFDVNYPIVIDDGTLAARFGGIFSVPTTYVIDANGQIVQRIIGLFPVETMKPVLEPMMEKAPSG